MQRPCKRASAPRFRWTRFGQALFSAPKDAFSFGQTYVSNPFTEPVPDSVPSHWRAQFDLAVSGSEPVEMRLFLRQGDKVLSETWLYQYVPSKPASSELANEEVKVRGD